MSTFASDLLSSIDIIFSSVTLCLCQHQSLWPDSTQMVPTAWGNRPEVQLDCILANDCLVVLPTGPGNPPVVRDWTGKTVWFGSRPVQKPNPLCLGGVVTLTRQRTVSVWPGWNWTVVPTLLFLHLWLQSRFWVLIVSCHDEYADCAVLRTLSPPAFRFVIRPIFVEWLWNKGRVQVNSGGFL